MEAVTNSTVLIVLARINRLDLLGIFKQMLTTKEIYSEVLAGKNIPEREKECLKDLFDKKIKIRAPVRKLNFDLGIGETSAISLCTESKILLFISDDKKARKTAEILGIKCLGTIGIILENSKQKIITKSEAKEIVKLIVLNSYYLSTDLYARVIELIERQ